MARQNIPPPVNSPPGSPEWNYWYELQYNSTNNLDDEVAQALQQIQDLANEVDGDISGLQAAVTNLTNTLTAINDTGTKYFKANSTGSIATASGVDSVAIGESSVASATNSVALGSNSTASTGAEVNYVAPGLPGLQTSSGEVNVGNRKITDVAPGSDDGDAVNVEQYNTLLVGQVFPTFFASPLNPTAAEIPAGTYKVWHNTALNQIRLWANNAGTLVSVVLT